MPAGSLPWIATHWVVPSSVKVQSERIIGYKSVRIGIVLRILITLPFLTDLQPILCNTAMYISIDIFCICLLEVCGPPCSKLLERKKKMLQKRAKCHRDIIIASVRPDGMSTYLLIEKVSQMGWSCRYLCFQLLVVLDSLGTWWALLSCWAKTWGATASTTSSPP